MLLNIFFFFSFYLSQQYTKGRGNLRVYKSKYSASNHQHSYCHQHPSSSSSMIHSVSRDCETHSTCLRHLPVPRGELSKPEPPACPGFHSTVAFSVPQQLPSCQRRNSASVIPFGMQNSACEPCKTNGLRPLSWLRDVPSPSASESIVEKHTSSPSNRCHRPVSSILKRPAALIKHISKSPRPACA